MAYNKLKTDPELGRRVHEHLVRCGVETPVVDNGLDRQTKIDLIENNFKDIMGIMGLDLEDDSLQDTPKRVAKMYVNEIFWGLDYEAFPKCTAVENKMKYDEMVIERNINVQSNCEHHFVVIDGVATVGYIPREKVLGLSKLNRVVEYFAKRPQVQERLTRQVVQMMQEALNTKDVACVIDAKHLCVNSRGIRDIDSSTITAEFGGQFNKPEVKKEFLEYLRLETTFK